MAITNEEAKLVHSSWEKAYENPLETGLYVLKAFLEKYDYYDKFPKFAGVPKDELPKNTNYQNHAMAIMKALNELVNSIHDEDKWGKNIYELVKRHKLRKITFKQFEEVSDVILTALKDVFKINAETEKAWGKVFHAFLKHVARGLE